MKKLLSALAILPFMATPAMADISSQFNTQGNVKSYCESMRDQDKTNHFWAINGFDNDQIGTMISLSGYNNDDKWSLYMVHKGVVYHVGGLGVTNKEVTKTTLCNNIKKLGPVNVEQNKWVDVSCMGSLGCSGGYYKKVLYKLENENIDLNLYTTNEEGKVFRKTIKNFSYMTF